MAIQRTVPTFFYGSFINRDVLARGGFVPGTYAVAQLCGYDIYIETLATLVLKPLASVYGILCEPTHDELSSLYRQSWLGNVYLPEAVLVHTREGQAVPALCYIAHQTPPAQPAPDYLDWILRAADDYQFPSWYRNRLVSAASDARS